MQTPEMAVHAADHSLAEHAVDGEGAIGESCKERPQDSPTELRLTPGHADAPRPVERQVLGPSLEPLAALDPIVLEGLVDQGQAPRRRAGVHVGRHRRGEPRHAARRVQEALGQAGRREQAVPRLDHDAVGVDHAAVPLDPALGVDDVKVEVDHEQLRRRVALRRGDPVEVGDEVHEAVAHDRHLGLVSGEDDAVTCPPRIREGHMPLAVLAVEPFAETVVDPVGHCEVVREVLGEEVQHVLAPMSEVVPAVRHVVVCKRLKKDLCRGGWLALCWHACSPQLCASDLG
mmetsp:Transcript_74573/g.231527  ORF Transcript_74573/g.231527 Transcript_74573/m.231527 type:complete len:288 (-) Transcript_74573:279-1142(-)